jgi:hypothetical protein
MPNGTSTAVTEATRLNEIGFPEFTAKLVKDVFDTLLAATLHQMEAYSELVAATAKTLEDYVAENKELVSGEEVWDWLVKNLPGPAASVAANPTPEDATLVRKDVALLVNDEVPKIRQKVKLDQNWTPSGEEGSLTIDSASKPTKKLIEPDVNTITAKVREIIAGNRYTLLKEMVKMGIIRLVVDYGEIETRLTFTTWGMSQQDRTEQESRVKALGLSYSRTAQTAVGGKLFKVINVSRAVQTSLAANYTSVSVRTTSSLDRDVSGSKVDIYARVFIRFKSDYVALGG